MEEASPKIERMFAFLHSHMLWGFLLIYSFMNSFFSSFSMVVFEVLLNDLSHSNLALKICRSWGLCWIHLRSKGIPLKAELWSGCSIWELENGCTAICTLPQFLGTWRYGNRKLNCLLLPPNLATILYKLPLFSKKKNASIVHPVKNLHTIHVKNRSKSCHTTFICRYIIS